ncbi:MAG: cysteine--tRNA ligase [Candidatus Aenigmatarchaeota archaeon]
MLKIFNTLKRKKEIFKPLEDRKVKMFVCGPTVYDFSHLGHAKTYIQFDMIARYLKYKGFDVFYLQNITDLDDKIIDRAKKEGVDWQTIARKFEDEYHKDMKALNVISVNKYARATDYIKEIISQVERLFKKGFAYEIEDGIYYDISKFKEYGKLSGRTALEAEDSVSRIDESVNKKNKGDFCLWKKSKPDEPKWPSPWFEGRPGWHIEDTAITEAHFGPQYDIHGGARDLIFPHHEAEIAQMEAISGKSPFVKYWLHTGFLTVNGKKMSKSLGNFVTIRDALKKYDAETIRFFFLSSHYKSPIDYNENNLEQAKKNLEKLYTTIQILKEAKKRKEVTRKEMEFEKFLMDCEKDFEKFMDDDFNTPQALRCLYKLSSETNSLLEKQKNEINEKLSSEIIETFKKLGYIFGILQKEIEEDKVPEEVKILIEEREKAREMKDFKKADDLREKIKSFGYMVEDTKDGPKVKKVNIESL